MSIVCCGDFFAQDCTRVLFGLREEDVGLDKNHLEYVLSLDSTRQSEFVCSTDATLNERFQALSVNYWRERHAFTE